jgi:hypothetical protein
MCNEFKTCINVLEIMDAVIIVMLLAINSVLGSFDRFIERYRVTCFSQLLTPKSGTGRYRTAIADMLAKAPTDAPRA